MIENIHPCTAAEDFTYRSQFNLDAFHDAKQLVKRLLPPARRTRRLKRGSSHGGS
jgi:hypothetical protein